MGKRIRISKKEYDEKTIFEEYNNKRIKKIELVMIFSLIFNFLFIFMTIIYILDIDEYDTIFDLKSSSDSEKAKFLDDNIVLVLEGYGNVYYSYDCANKLTGGDFTYWIYTKDEAIENGFKEGKC